MKKQTLLEKALENYSNKKKEKSVTDEQYELCIAYVKCEISFSTIIDVLELKHNNAAYPIIVAAFKRYVSENPVNK